ncbi:MAG: helicase [Endozoicomonadaceae bacterium]|nr:helicase [Endozoicomonadaceae bacterium]
MKFRLLLWALGFLMARASRTNPNFKKQLKDKDIVFQLTSDDGAARHYIVKNERIQARRGAIESPAFSINFSSAGKGVEALTAKNAQAVFMQGIQNKDIVIQGNPALVMWFQSLTKELMPKKKKKAKAA